MAETKIISRSVSTFTQPALEGTVSVIMHTMIDWLRIGVWIYIPNGGVYEITNITANVCLLKLKTAEAATGDTVQVNIMYPVNKNEETAYSWGSKEW